MILGFRRATNIKQKEEGKSTLSWKPQKTNFSFSELCRTYIRQDASLNSSDIFICHDAFSVKREQTQNYCFCPKKSAVWILLYFLFARTTWASLNHHQQTRSLLLWDRQANGLTLSPQCGKRYQMLTMQPLVKSDNHLKKSTWIVFILSWNWGLASLSPSPYPQLRKRNC